MKKNPPKSKSTNKQTSNTQSVEKSTAPSREMPTKFQLYTTSFLCGAMVMVLEMTGSRVFAPYLGTSLIVWTSLIGIVLASLSFGYWFGGIVADKHPDTFVLAKIIFFSGLVVAAVGVFYPFLMETLTSGTRNLYVSAIVCSVVLFAVPAGLLGMVSPFVARLALEELQSAGAVVGRLYALSSIGSILGTFLGGFILISFLKTGTILFLIAAILLCVAVLIRGKQPSHQNRFPSRSVAALCVVFCFLCGVFFHLEGDSLLPAGAHWDTHYNHIRVYDENTSYGKVRSLQTDPGTTSQSRMLVEHPNVLVSRYTEYHKIAFHLNPQLKEMLVIGGGGYCIPKYVLTNHADVNVDVVEIDPEITNVARKLFFLTDEMVDGPRLNIYHEDARQFLRSGQKQERKKYDFVFGDAFNSNYNIPFHLTTKEYMEEISACMSEDGIFMTNIIASVEGPKCKLFQGFHRALAEVFPHVAVFVCSQPDDKNVVQNIVLAGFKRSYDLTAPEETEETSFLIDLLKTRREIPVSQKTPPLTDAFAPVEWYVLD